MNRLHEMEYAVQIAWDYLERTGQIQDGGFTSRFLMAAVQALMDRGETRRLKLSNSAIVAYEQIRAKRAA